MVEEGPTATTRTPRSRRVHEAVLDATAALLLEGGLPRATIDAIHARSGVSKTTIYKHWPNRLCLAVDAFAARMASEPPPRDTGTARGDLLDAVRRAAAASVGPSGPVLAQLVAQAAQDPQAAGWLRERVLDVPRNDLRHLWAGAVARGEGRDDVDPEVVVDLLLGPIMWRLVGGHRPLTRREADKLAATALDGLLR